MEGDLRLVRFTHNGIPDIGEAITNPDGSLTALLPEPDGTTTRILIQDADGLMPPDISDMEIIQGTDPAIAEARLQELQANVNRTSQIIDAYENGSLSKEEAGKQLWENLFGNH